ncbi:hypothetical protein JIX56_05505 [Streptomyces sp. CA-210063]|uniref:hypothetical protein n=1 Tax=Streptomyces sp. CA-210063 TaxID=2801029 RepID=UPI00214C144A|nr:hypothetical protein [Streptomyces sp. CA-210063]UUU37431.1 hypothetical protein JIX56_05505 [Streptomyces sp. CA-210063]
MATPVAHAQELVAGIAHAALEVLDTAHLAAEDPRALWTVLQARLNGAHAEDAQRVPPLD